jgi:hypothetical protein
MQTKKSVLIAGPDPFSQYEVLLTEPSRVESSQAVTIIDAATSGCCLEYLATLYARPVR